MPQTCYREPPSQDVGLAVLRGPSNPQKGLPPELQREGVFLLIKATCTAPGPLHKSKP